MCAVEVAQNNRPRIHRVIATADVGLAINPLASVIAFGGFQAGGVTTSLHASSSSPGATQSPETMRGQSHRRVQHAGGSAARQSSVLARVGGTAARGQPRDASQGCGAELPAMARCHSRRAADRPLRDVHHSRRRPGANVSDALLQKAREGVQVCLLYDWMGRIRQDLTQLLESVASRWRRCPVLQPTSLPISLSVRSVATTARRSSSTAGIAFVTGLCVGRMGRQSGATR